ncbi:MAG TPA: sulfite oxidase [Gemmataceae bacterium]|jgi:DMSO/TMAO reductase YedYZ molybdopterin-dependent catalytic subunit
MNARPADSNRTVLDRRAFLGGATAGALPLVSTVFNPSARAETPPARSVNLPGVILRQKNPDNVEFPFATLDSFLTPNERFYVRSHFDVPNVDVKTWRLKVEGAVKKPFEIDYDELCKMPSHTLTSLLECSGNSRVFLKPPQLGIRWELGGVSNAEWTGVRLADVLERAGGVRERAVEVILEGADQGEFKPPLSKSPGVISYARSLPLKKARRPEVLLAYKMNGKDLPRAHGAPVRALVAGWYGMASVKWLKRLVVTERPFQGYFQTFMYTTWDRGHGVPELVPVGAIEVKSEIARPVLNEIVPAKSTYRVFGAAWAGESEVVHVEVSTDGGQSWSAAKLLDKSAPYTWRLWEYTWRTPADVGPRVLMARATDAMGRIQPLKRDDDRRDAVISHVLPIEVEVR